MEVPVICKPDEPSYSGIVYEGYSPSGVVYEQYLDRSRLAEIMGTPAKTVDRFVVLGVPPTTWGFRSRRSIPSQAIAWAEQDAKVAR